MSKKETDVDILDRLAREFGKNMIVQASTDDRYYITIMACVHALAIHCVDSLGAEDVSIFGSIQKIKEMIEDEAEIITKSVSKG